MQQSSIDVVTELVKNIQEDVDSVDNLLTEVNKQLHEIIITPLG